MVGEWLRKNLSLYVLLAWRDKTTPLQRQLWEGLKFMIQYNRIRIDAQQRSTGTK